MWVPFKRIDTHGIPLYDVEGGDAGVCDGAAHRSNPPPRTDRDAADARALRADDRITALGYTIVPVDDTRVGREVLSWMMPPWATAHDPPHCLRALTQVEYYFVGNAAGQLLLLPVLPPHFRHALRQECAAQEAPPWESGGVWLRGGGPRRVLHTHPPPARPVTAVDYTGTLVCSAAGATVMLGVYHPLPAGCPAGAESGPVVVTLPPGRPVCDVKLWCGTEWTARARPRRRLGGDGSTSEHTRAVRAAAEREDWWGAMVSGEAAAVYVFTADADAVLRLWRADVVTGAVWLMHVLLGSRTVVGMRSSLDYAAAEDNARVAGTGQPAEPLHSICLDGDGAAVTRVLAVTASGVVYVWALDALAWTAPLRPHAAAASCPSAPPLQLSSSSSSSSPPRPYACAPASEGDTTGRVEATTTRAVWVRHPLCWDEDTNSPMSWAMAAEGAAAGDTAAAAAAARVLRRRVERLMGRHVWIRDLPASWGRRYAARVGGGAAVGVVSNGVLRRPRQTCLGRMDRACVAHTPNREDGWGIAAAAEAAETMAPHLTTPDTITDWLNRCVIPVCFESGECGRRCRERRVPLWCVEPVVYPLVHWHAAAPGGGGSVSMIALSHTKRVAWEDAAGRGRGGGGRRGGGGVVVTADGVTGILTVWVWEAAATPHSSYRPVCRVYGGETALWSPVSALWGHERPGEDGTRPPARMAMPSSCAESAVGGRLYALGATGAFVSAAATSSVVREWWVMEEPEWGLRQVRSLQLAPSCAGDRGKGRQRPTWEHDDGAPTTTTTTTEGVICAAVFAPLDVLFLVRPGSRRVIETYQRVQTLGCALPENYVFDGTRSIRLASSVRIADAKAA